MIYDSTLDFFREIAKIPHGSGNTKALSDFLKKKATDGGLEAYQDKYNNLLIKKPAQNSASQNPVILQGHLDMVLEKEKNCTKNMSKEGLDLVFDGDILYAKGTTLGGDDGIAVAMIFAVLFDKSISHPPIEALLTVDEETGMDGAVGFDKKRLSGKRLINIDSEEEGVAYGGCAGSFDINISKIFDTTQKNNAVKITIEGLRGGHSGCDIHKGHVNAGYFLINALSKYDLCLAKFKSGTKMNVIPCFAEAIVSSPDIDCEALENELHSLGEVTAKVKAEAVSGDFDFLSSDDTAEFFYTLLNFKTGVISFFTDTLVKSSKNLAIISLENGVANVSCHARSIVNADNYSLRNTSKVYFENLGYTCEYSDISPAWEYRDTSPLFDIMNSEYEKIAGRKMTRETIHAGLECGLFVDFDPEIDAISIGPDIRDIHTPMEKLSLSSTRRICTLLENTLKRL